MICILPQEDALLSREGHLGSCSRQGEDGPEGASWAWGCFSYVMEDAGLGNPSTVDSGWLI